MGISIEDDREEDMSGLGAVALIRRCIKHIWTHRRLFLSILALIMIPTAVLEDVALVLTGLRPVLKQFIHQLAAGNFTALAVEPSMIIQTTASALACELLGAVLSTIRYICIVFTVGSILTNKTVVLADAAGAVPRLWRPVLLTSLCFFAFTFGSDIIEGAIMSALFLFSNPALLLLARLALLLDAVLLVFLSFAFQFGLVVPVLEGVSGWKALGKSWKLLQGKKWVAFKIIFLTFLLVWFVPFVIQFLLQLIILARGFSSDSTPVLFISHTLSLFLLSVYHLLLVGTQTVLYFSCKALHQESITDSAFFKMQVMKGGYEQITQHSESYDVESAKETGSQFHLEKKPLQHVVVVP